ncbi:MAG: hypothetical protein H6662_18435 [Ardenticatenaceae bacterium]|nr:hypothetical protein [Anaerolineales bacterium]MCB8923569.1 hypothetical protein [Ardenticatenaceae bacterium]MCB8991718.1 hypothetical protein [Ardenticatenaceae bacterium]
MQSLRPQPQSSRMSPLFALKLTFPAQDFQTNWTQCSLLANYMAEYTAYQFTQQERAENIISTVANELLETAVHLATPHSDLTLHLEQHAAGLQLEVSLLPQPDLATAYTAFLQDLADDVGEQAYMQWLTAVTIPPHYFNQLGLMMIAHDFSVRITSVSLASERICTRLFIPNEELQA